MEEEKIIFEKLEKLRKRLKLLMIEKSTAKAALFGLSASLLLLFIDKLFFIPYEDLSFFILVLCAGSLGVGFTYGLFKKISLLEVSIKTDLKLNLKERLSTTVECLQNNEKGDIVKALIKDATNCSRNIDPNKVFPLTPPKETKFLASIVLIIILLSIIPGENFLFSKNEVEKPIDVEVLKNIKEEGKKLEEFSKELDKKAKEEGLNETKRIAEKMQNLSLELQSKNLTKAEALARIKDIKEEIEKSMKNLHLNEDYKDALSRAAGFLEKAELTKDVAKDLKSENYTSAGKKMEKLAKSIGSDNYTDEQLKELSESLKNAGETLLNSSMASTGFEMYDAGSALANGNKTSASIALEKAGKNLQAHGKTVMDARSLESAYTQLRMSQQAIANTGKEHGQNSNEQGQGKISSGKSSGKKQGQSSNGLGPGKNGAGPEAGIGSTNQEGGSGVIKPQPFKNRQSERTSEERGTFEKIYAPEKINTEGKEVRIGGSAGEGESSAMEIRGAPSEGEAFVPYTDAY
ncbi:MAG: hypothetical protein ACE5KE_01265, partial [Methanosarcinales archaeon]